MINRGFLQHKSHKFVYNTGFVYSLNVSDNYIKAKHTPTIMRAMNFRSWELVLEDMSLYS